MNILFGNLIDYQDYARKNIMTILLALKSKISNSQMKISPLNKLKLRFLSRDEDSEVIEPALSLLECSVSCLLIGTHYNMIYYILKMRDQLF